MSRRELKKNIIMASSPSMLSQCLPHFFSMSKLRYEMEKKKTPERIVSFPVSWVDEDYADMLCSLMRNVVKLIGHSIFDCLEHDSSIPHLRTNVTTIYGKMLTNQALLLHTEPEYGDQPYRMVLNLSLPKVGVISRIVFYLDAGLPYGMYTYRWQYILEELMYDMKRDMYMKDEHMNVDSEESDD